MAEARKSDFTGDVFGEWTVLRKADTLGDRIRRWVVGNAEGVEMTVAQTGLKDLALAKALKDKAEITDALRAEASKPLSRQIADAVIQGNAEAKDDQEHDERCAGVCDNPFADVFPAEIQDHPASEDIVVDSANPFETEEDTIAAVSDEPAGPLPTDVVDAVAVIGSVAQQALDAVLKAKVALNAASKALEQLV